MCVFFMMEHHRAIMDLVIGLGFWEGRSVGHLKGDILRLQRRCAKFGGLCPAEFHSAG